MGDRSIPTNRWQLGVTLYVAADMGLNLIRLVGGVL